MGQLERAKQVHFPNLNKARLDAERAEKERLERGEPEQPIAGPKPTTKKKGSKPVRCFLEGRIETRIWENKGDGGRPDWKIEQVRLYTYSERQGEAKTFRHENLDHARAGLTKARLWIEKEERHRGLRRKSWWWPFS